MDTGGLGVAFAVLTPVGLLVEAGTESYGHFDFFDADDEFVLRQDYAAFGFQFELGDGWHLVPKLGRPCVRRRRLGRVRDDVSFLKRQAEA